MTADLQFRPYHDRAVTLAMLTAFSGPPVTHKPRGGYRVEPCFAKRADPRRVRRNSERHVERPVEPLPAREARACHVFALIAGDVPDVPTWRGARRVHAPSW